MNKVYISYNSIISSLGFDSETVVEAIKNEVSGISRIDDSKLFHKPFYGSVVDRNSLSEQFKEINSSRSGYTDLEKMMILSLNKVIQASKLNIDSSVGLIISTTKGNINALEEESSIPQSYAYLLRLSNVLKDYFSFLSKPIIVYNACVSGVQAIAIAK